VRYLEESFPKKHEETCVKKAAGIDEYRLQMKRVAQDEQRGRKNFRL
jgi:hypothetical protein